MTSKPRSARIASAVYRSAARLLLGRTSQPIEEMQVVFEDAAVYTFTRRGAAGVMAVTIGEVVDLARTAVRRRTGRLPGITMPPSWGSSRRGKGQQMHKLLRDFRTAVRSLASNRVTSAIALGTLALGIGLNTAMFSILDSVVLRPVPFRDAARLAEVWNEQRPSKFTYPRFKRDVFLEWRKQTDLFDRVEGYEAESAVYRGSAGAEMVAASFVTPGLLPMLGVAPVQGRLFTDGDGRGGTDALVVISERFWHSHLKGDPAAIGRSIVLNGRPHQIVGMMPASFQFPNEPQLLWLPIEADQPPATTSSAALTLVAFVRFAPERTAADVATAVAARGEAINVAGGGRAGIGASLNSRQRFIDNTTRRSVLVLAGAVGFLLLIVCANVANLALSRTLGQSRSFAVRSALGASRWDLVRGTLVENGVVGVTGAALGLLIAQAAVHVTNTFLPKTFLLVSQNPIDLDGRALLFTIGAGLLTALVFGLPPAFVASRTGLTEVLSRDSRSSTGSRASTRTRSVLAIAEVSLALVLLAGAALMGRSFMKLQGVDRGFDTNGLIALRLGFPVAGYSDPRASDDFTKRLVERLRLVPGVSAATEGDVPPDSSLISFGAIERADAPGEKSKDVILPVYRVWPNYFSTVGIPIKEGRAFQPGDDRSSLIVSESFAREYWPHGGAIGRQVRLEGGTSWRTIVGVAGEVRQLDLDDRNGSFEWYYPSQIPPGAVVAPTQRASTEIIGGYRTYLVRAANPAGAIATLADAAHDIDDNVVVWKTQLVNDAFGEAVSRPRIVLIALMVCAGTGLLLAAAGIYGVLTCLVGQRRREIGVRLALGATPRGVFVLIMKDGAGLALIGVAIGCLVSFGAGRLIRSLLYEVEPTDPLSLLVVSAVLFGAAVFAAWHPARRAMRVDPIPLLRGE